MCIYICKVYYLGIIDASSVPLSFAVNLFQIEWCSKSWAFDHLGATLIIILQDRFCSNVSRLRLSAFIHNVASVFRSEDWSGDAWGSILQTWISFCAPMRYLFHNHIIKNYQTCVPTISNMSKPAKAMEMRRISRFEILSSTLCFPAFLDSLLLWFWSTCSLS